MKTLHLLRHAKSSWLLPELDDHERDLNDRGRRDAPRMGAALAAKIAPQRVHCSSALRARRTLEGLYEGWPELKAQAHRIDDALYTFDYQALVVWLQDFATDTEQCFLVGHNPALTELCNTLLGRRALDNLPTCGYLQLQLSIDAWEQVAPGVATLELWQFPKDLD